MTEWNGTRESHLTIRCFPRVPIWIRHCNCIVSPWTDGVKCDITSGVSWYNLPFLLIASFVNSNETRSNNTFYHGPGEPIFVKVNMTYAFRPCIPFVIRTIKAYRPARLSQGDQLSLELTHILLLLMYWSVGTCRTIIRLGKCRPVSFNCRLACHQNTSTFVPWYNTTNSNLVSANIFSCHKRVFANSVTWSHLSFSPEKCIPSNL